MPSAPQTAARLALRALELTLPGDPCALPRAVAAAEALTAAGRLDQAARIAHDALAQPLPPVAEARLRCTLSSVLCARGQAQDAAAEARTVLVQPQLPDGLRDQAMAAHLQALAGSRAELATSLVGTVLAAPDRHDRHVVVAALVTRAIISWDQGQIGEGLELLRDAARYGSGTSPDARQVQPLLVLTATLIDLRQLDEAEDVLRAADSPALHGIPAQAALSILRARIHLARGRLADAADAGQSALATAEAFGAHGYACTARCVLGLIELRRGDVAAAAEHVAGAAEALAAGNPGYPAVTAAAAHSLGLAGQDPDRLAEAAAQQPDPWAQASAAEDLGVLHAGRRIGSRPSTTSRGPSAGTSRPARPPIRPGSGPGSASSACGAGTGPSRRAGRSAGGTA